jgi:hypothetical protein
LAEASAVLTHAGHGSVLKSLAAGVPLVCAPMGRDQRDNTVRELRRAPGWSLLMSTPRRSTSTLPAGPTGAPVAARAARDRVELDLLPGRVPGPIVVDVGLR